MTMAIPEFPGDVSGSQMMTVEYNAENGDVYLAKAIWYRIQEALNELSRMAYENNTSVMHVRIY